MSISASVTGQQLDVGDRSVTVRVTWNATCQGAESGAHWFGSLSLDDPKGSGSIYMGGVSGASGSADQLVGRAEETRAVTPVLRLSCASESDLHVNLYDAGAGADVVRAANGRRETVRCGPGHDRVRADQADRLRDCERVTRVG